jgi:hypothetical protein
MSQRGILTLPLSVGLLMTCFGTVACAEQIWRLSMRPYLEARSQEPESDAIFRAFCRSPNAIEIRVGAADNVGKGQGENVMLKFSSGGQVAILHGVSRRSDEYQMTGGAELVTEIKPTDDVFKLLELGGPLNISGSIKKPTVWTSDQMATSVKNFLATCTGQ